MNIELVTKSNGAHTVDITYGKMTDAFTVDTIFGVFTFTGASVRALCATVEVLEKDAKAKQ